MAKALAYDSLTGTLFIADSGNYLVRQATRNGTFSTYAGSYFAGHVNGDCLSSAFGYPVGIAVHSGSGNIYIADSGNSAIRKITRTPTCSVSTLAGSGVPGFADGVGSAARFNTPQGIAVDANEIIYVADKANHRIRMVTAGGVVSTLAGKGTAGFLDGLATSEALLNSPLGVEVDAFGTVYVADTSNHRIRKIVNGVVSTLAGNGTTGSVNGNDSSLTTFYSPYDLTVDPYSGVLYIADHMRHLIRAIAPDGSVSTLSGIAGAMGNVDGSSTTAKHYNPTAIALDFDFGMLYTLQLTHHYLRRVSASTGAVTTIAGLGGASGMGKVDGRGTAAQFNDPISVAFDPRNGELVVSEWGNSQLRIVSTDGVVRTPTFAKALLGPRSITVDQQGNIYGHVGYTVKVLMVTGTVVTLAGLDGAGAGYADGVGSEARFTNSISGIAVDEDGNVYVADYRLIRKISPNRTVTTIAGNRTASVTFRDGIGQDAILSTISDLALDNKAETLYVADNGNGRIRKIRLADNNVTTLRDHTGAHVIASSATGVAVDTDGNVYTRNGQTVIRITPRGVVTTLGGQYNLGGNVDGIGSAARFNHFYGIAVNSSTGTLYLAEMNNNRIRKIT